MMKNTLVILLALFCELALAQSGCQNFNKVYDDAASIVSTRRQHEKKLQEKGYVLTSKDIGFERSRDGLTCNTTNYWLSSSGTTADNLNTAARLMSDNDPSAFSSFDSNAKCLNRFEKELKSHPKYRPLNGYGNNLKHPHWGTPNMPFGRHGPKNYDDGVSSIRKSVKGSELPSPRKLVLDVLLKAEKPPRTSNEPNQLFIINELYISHDMAHQVPVEAFDNCKEIRCCSSGNKKVLDPSVSHSACLPIAISKDDEFYGKANVGCLNMVRSESSSLASTIQHGEVMNKVTAFLDHSIIYGSEVSENDKVRSFVGGKLNLGPNNLLPTDINGKYTKISDRLTTVPLSAVFPVLLARNHNNFADRLAKVNPKWNDEKLFQEARRLNIATYQKNVFHSLFTEVLGAGIYADYDETIDPSATLDFFSATYRYFHINMNPWMLLVDKDNKVEKIPMSDTFGRIDIAEKRFDDLLRGTLDDKMNFGQHTDELYNKFAKNEQGLGLDIFSIDIQRCRDHGLPTFLESRKQCGLKSDFKTFEDLLEIFPQSYVDLLKEAYEDVRDIDLYVGGSLESFLLFNEAFVGQTFIAIIFAQFYNLIKGDAYYFTHKNSPYPFTDAQLATIEAFHYPHLICQNSGLKSIAKEWLNLANNRGNPLIPCSDFMQIDLSAWKNI